MSEPRESEIVIEIDNEQVIKHEPIYDIRTGSVLEERDPTRSGNCDYYFYPVEKTLRSGFRPLRCGSPPPPLVNIDYIPGQRIHVDMAAREGRITDALGDKSNQSLYARVQRAWKACEIIGPMGQPIKDEVHGLRNEELFWTWLYWMRRCLDGNPPNESYARAIQNVHLLPSLEEIIKTKKVMLPIYEGSARVVLNLKDAHMTPELAGISGDKPAAYTYGQEDGFQKA